MQTATRVISDLTSFEPAMTQIDMTGVGSGVVDRVRQVVGKRHAVVGVHNGGKAANETKFANRAAEMWWMVRESFERDQIGFDMADPEAVDELVNDLNRPTYFYNRKQQLVIDKFGLPRGTSEYSLSADERAEASPDRGDSYVLAYTAAKPFIQLGETKLVRSRSYMPRVPAGGVRI